MSWLHHTRLVLVIVVVSAIFLIGGMYLLGIQADWVEMLYDMREKPWVMLITGSIYALCLAVPFVPGVEIGLLLMIIFGRSGILMAYLATVIGLTVAFSVGLYLRSHFRDYVPLKALRARARRFSRVGSDQLSESHSGRWLHEKIRRHKPLYPYLLTGVLFNIPGNWLIGGGGGIALMGGLSGQMRWLPFVLMVMLATCAVPLLAWFGLVELEQWLPRE